MKLPLLQIIIILIGLCSEISILPVWSAADSIIYPFFLHLFAVFCLSLGFVLYERSQSRKSKLRAVYLYCLFLVVFFPVLGIIFSGILYLGISASLINFTSRDKAEDDDIFQESRKSENGQRAVFHDREKFLREVSFESFVDIMISHEVKTKVKVIEKLSQQPTQDTIKLLKSAVRDPIAEIRLYAAGVLLKIENKMNKQIQMAISAVRTHGSAKTFSHLASLYWYYATIGILDHVLSKYYLGLCAENYRCALKLDHEQPHIVVCYSRCLLELGEMDKAKTILEDAAKKWPQNSDIIFLRGEMDFKLFRFKRVPTYFRSIQINGLNEQQRHIVEFWSAKN